MLGAIIGDIAGSRFEFNNNRSKDFIFFTHDCFITDDSIMTLSVAKAIVACKENYDHLGELAVKYMREIGGFYPDCGYGGMFRHWIFDEKPEPYNSFGNGAAMRVSACGFAARTEEEAKRFSKAVTEVSHNHPEGIKGAEAVSIAIFMAKNGATKQEIRRRIECDYYSLNFTLDGIRDSYSFNETCQGTVPQAIVAFLESVSFEDAIRSAISIGGDSDTLAAIAGSIAEAYYGIHKNIEKAAMKFLDGRLRDIYKEWKKFLRTIYAPQKLRTITKYIDKLDDHDSLISFIGEFHSFIRLYDEHTIIEYVGILEKNGIKWTEESMREANVEELDETAILALIVGVFRADHFSYGVIENFSRCGLLTKWLRRLKEIDDVKPIEPEYPEVITMKIDMLHGIRSESLEITQHELAITEHIGELGIITHRYEYNEGFIAEAVLHILEETGKTLASDGWLDTDEASHKDYFIYTLTALYDDGVSITHHGIYNRVHIPEKPWGSLIKTIQSFLGMFAFGNVIKLDGFMNAMKPGEVKYCGVEFSESGKTYHYRTTDLRIAVGDTVVVPVGHDNYEREATVTTIELCHWDNTPYPLEKTKEILRKVGDEIDSIPTLHLLDFEAMEEDGD
jgi:ADP-ribosylglycohydrolase